MSFEIGPHSPQLCFESVWMIGKLEAFQKNISVYGLYCLLAQQTNLLLLC